MLRVSTRPRISSENKDFIGQDNDSLKRRTSSRRATFKWLVRRIFRVFGIWMLACLLLSLLIEALPGDAATVLVGKGGQELVELTRAKMGLDRPWHVRYFEWLGGVFRGDLGSALTSGTSVAEMVSKPLMASLTLFVIVMVALVLVTIPLSLIMGYKRGKASAFFSTLSIAVNAVPEFITTIILLGLLSMGLRLLPVLSIPGPGRTVWDRPITMVMPALCMWIVCSAVIYRRICALVKTYSGAAYIREAELAGIPRGKILVSHLFPSIRSGVGQLIAQTVPYLLGGAVVIEYVTSYPGMGLTLFMAIEKRDTPVIMAMCGILILVSAVFYSIADYFVKKNERVTEVV